MNNEIEVLNPIEEKSTTNSLMGLDNLDRLLSQAERAEKAMVALKKVMEVSLKITTEQDWVLIGGTPYLQESGATKVAKLFGISWEILNQETTKDSEGYKTFHYRMKFYDSSTSVEAEGSRCCKDIFFSKSKDGIKKPDEIDEGDVKRAAYTNCVNTGIKRMIPGLRGIDIKTLESAKLEPSKMKGYTFKEGTKGGTTAPQKNENSGLVCETCGKAVTQQVASYSQGKFSGHTYCYDCQKNL